MIDIDTLLAWGGVFKKIKAGEIIFQEGVHSPLYYQLVEGKVRWVNINEQGKEFIQILIEPGECFGEFALFDDGPFAATAIADEDSVIIRLHKDSFYDILKENPQLHFKFSKLLTQRLRFKFLILKELANHNPENSISSLLKYFKEHQKNICTKCNKLKLTRQQIADMTGFRVETVIRTMKNMQQKGELIINKGKVYC
ncbi:MAG: Crp/Fnr family transcriptional regulator [Ferruginibacter sp.]|nr:Crp/Fnr family transcriptional regulator [Bacteroidota bacterium]MBX2919361.1 Crp/Fnr family transcriptional regulator [Ferruginibacter sp.]MCB0710137.1 Crp/Fnr family transcriptional regulator [Chitinophagaceae bacterium]MCC7378976.1 Crp/Fnr family transcriptional regulator [Chitinophagaceae bacterium]